MKKLSKNSSLISLDSNGRVIINDTDLLKLAVGAQSTSSDSSDTNGICGKNAACSDSSCSEKKDKKDIATS